VRRWPAATAYSVFAIPWQGSPTGARGEGSPHPVAVEGGAQVLVEKGRLCPEPAAMPASVDLERVAGLAPPHPIAGRARAARMPLRQEGRRQSPARVLRQRKPAGSGARGQPAERAPAVQAPWGRAARGRAGAAQVVPAQAELEPAELEPAG